ncbi:GAF and ANTAR domain-containing protein [Agreia sp. COWG]|uniref:GAF and ANTAR domain-containing protein n=1 Tax=Agreia sp. COWG TaxID=2773266 RepID=UPI0019295D7E|nr:GAF and ANTAR domain-containing protein [Agreia sp. COWG]
MDASRETQLAEAFVTLADTLVADYDVVDLVHTLVTACASLVDASAAGLALADRTGRLEVLASTSEESRLVDLMQLRAGQGPCVEAFTSGTVVSVPDVGQVVGSWPTFVRGAEQLGLRSAHCIPMRLRGETLGSLNLFWRTPGVLPESDVAVARGLADIATIGILHQRAVAESDVARRQLQHALDSRVLIEQAKGVISHTHSLDMDAAFALLRDHARVNGRRLQEVADDVVARRLTL